MKIYIVRHGETLWNKEEVFRGTKDIPLNEQGVKQARHVGAYFTGIPVKRIVSSPLQRAVSTAHEICATTGIPIETINEFIDINFGIWEGLPLQEVEKKYPVDFATWRRSPERFHVNGGESLNTVRKRVLEGLAKVTTNEETTIIVTHRVICKVIVLACLNIGNDHFWDMKFDPASITLLYRDGDSFVLSLSNETCHLKQSMLQDNWRDF
jgi:broad specificity phosphatase PhoE